MDYNDSVFSTLCKPEEGDFVGLPANRRDGAPSCAKVYFAPFAPESRFVFADDFMVDSSTECRRLRQVQG